MSDTSQSKRDRTLTWYGPPEPEANALGLADWGRVVRRGLPFGVTVFGGLALLLLVRLVERPLFGLHRPITPWITRGVCVAAFWWLGMARQVQGTPMSGRGAAVANHVSWLDIFALNASDSLYFVAKSEVARWPAIGWLARATGTVFVRRDPRDASRQADMLADRLEAGHRLLFFPEGTSTDGLQVLPFKTTLFAPVFAAPLKDDAQIQAVTLKYAPPPGADLRFYGWWGDMDFGASLLRMLAAPVHGRVEITYHPPVRVAQFDNRKALAARCEALVRSALQT